MDIKHVLAANPLRPAYRGFDARPATAGPDGGRRRGSSTPAASCGRPRRRRLRLRQRDAPPRRAAEPVRASRSQPGDRRRLAGVHRPTAATGSRRPVDVRRLGHASRPRAGRRPSYWIRDAMTAGWSRRSPAPGRSTPTSRSCHVSWYEADAFARWAGCRLPDRGRVGGGRCDQGPPAGVGRDGLPAPPDSTTTGSPARVSIRRRLPGRRAVVRRRLAVDGQPLRPLPGLPARRRRGRRVQRQVHGQPAGPAGRRLRHPRGPQPPDLPQLLPRRRPAGRSAACAWRSTGERQPPGRSSCRGG